MREGVTEPFRPAEPEPDYDWDYEPEGHNKPPRVLWGRVVALVAIVVLAFLLGFLLAPDGASETALADAQNRVDALEEELEATQAQLAALEQQDEAVASPSPTSTAGEETSAGESEGETQTYVVEENDTLRDIAQEFYGDASLADFLAEHNGIEDPGALAVGQEIEIPPEPEE